MNQKSTKPGWYRHGAETGWIGITGRELVRFLEKEYGELSEEELLIVIFTSLFREAGHVTLPLDKSPAEWGAILDLEESAVNILSSETDKVSSEILLNGNITGEPGQKKPFILETRSGRQFVSIYRFRRFEETILQWIEERSRVKQVIENESAVRSVLSELFANTDEPDWQKTAALLSLIQPFLIISGGPGTGKTTTVARILALNQKLNQGSLKIALAAPTGKAAGRMGEALQSELNSLNLTETERKSIPAEAKTIHRLLRGTEERGLLPAPEKKMLHADLVIVDEASMVDLTLMYRLMTHLSDHTRLILLGDKDQLASVEAGSVFADLCRKKENGFSSDLISRAAPFIDTDLPFHSDVRDAEDAIVYLTRSYRFGKESGIGTLAGAVKEPDGNPQVLQERVASVFSTYDDLSHEPFSYSAEDLKKLSGGLVSRIEEASTMEDPGGLIDFWKQSARLTCHRRGLEGSERLNAYTEQMLAASRIVPMKEGWYHGRPVMITRNDYSLGVFNGDMGVCVKEPGSDSAYKVWIETAGGLKPIHTNRLVHVVPAYFLTVHKSQGSEFRRVSLMLPSADSPVLTRELLYTAITRAKNEFQLLGSMELFLKGIAKKTQRFTLLGSRVT